MIGPGAGRDQGAVPGGAPVSLRCPTVGRGRSPRRSCPVRGDAFLGSCGLHGLGGGGVPIAHPGVMACPTIGRRALVPVAGATLVGELSVPAGALALVMVAHGANEAHRTDAPVATALADGAMATLCLTLLTENEGVVDARTGHVRFDVGLLASRLVTATDWIQARPETSGLAVGYFGDSTAAAAALVAAATRPKPVSAVVSLSGRPDLAVHVLDRVQVPTLLIVGGHDPPLVELNRAALARLRVESKLEVVRGAGHRFKEPGAMETAAHLARRWFERHLGQVTAA